MLSPLIGVGEEEPAGDTEVKRHAGVCVFMCERMPAPPCPSRDKLFGSLEMESLISGQMFYFDRCRTGALWVMESVTNYNLGKLKNTVPPD